MQPTLPTDLTDDELASDWTLSEPDLAEVRRCRGDDNRHSFAIQLCVLRRYGRFLGDDYGSVPIQILNHIGRQLGMAPMLFATAPARKQTDTAHERRLREHLGFSTFNAPDRGDLEHWVRARAAGGMLVDELIIRAEEYLCERKVVLPARSTIERLVRSIASRAEEDKMAGIYQRLPAALCTAIDELLVVREDAARSRLEELRDAGRTKECRNSIDRATAGRPRQDGSPPNPSRRAAPYQPSKNPLPPQRQNPIARHPAHAPLPPRGRAGAANAHQPHALLTRTAASLAPGPPTFAPVPAAAGAATARAVLARA